MSKFLPGEAARPAIIRKENKGCIKLALNQAKQATFHTKHMELQLHYVRSKILKNAIKL